jgi:hypothetical protein
MDHLSKLLSSWEPPVPEQPAFRRNVWQRIAAAELEPRHGLRRWIEAILVSISRPRIAVAAACAAVALGIAAGNLSAQSSSEAAAYLRSVNPYAHANPAL